MSSQALTEGLIGVVPWRLAKGLIGVVPWIANTMGLAKNSSRSSLWRIHKRAWVKPLPAARFLGKERQWCASLTHQLYPGFGNPWERAQSTNKSVVVATTKNTQRTEPVAVGIGQYVSSVTSKVIPVDCCVCRPCWERWSCLYMGPCFGQWSLLGCFFINRSVPCLVSLGSVWSPLTLPCSCSWYLGLCLQ